MSEIDDFLSKIDEPQRVELQRIRKLVQQTVSEAEESISYGMPAFKYKGKPLIYYNAFKDHMSVFPTPGPAAHLANELKDYKVSKGTIQFTLEKPLSDELIKKLLHARLNQINNK